MTPKPFANTPLVLLLLMAACSSDRDGEPEAADPPEPTEGHEATPPEPQQAPHPLPATLTLEANTSGDEWTNLTVEAGELPWAITGCERSARGGCEETGRVELTEAQRHQYAAAIQALRAMPRCEPVAHTDADIETFLSLAGDAIHTWIPVAWLDGAAPSDDPCTAEQRLAWFVVSTYRAGS